MDFSRPADLAILAYAYGVFVGMMVPAMFQAPVWSLVLVVISVSAVVFAGWLMWITRLIRRLEAGLHDISTTASPGSPNAQQEPKR